MGAFDRLAGSRMVFLQATHYPSTQLWGTSFHWGKKKGGGCGQHVSYQIFISLSTKCSYRKPETNPVRLANLRCDSGIADLPHWCVWRRWRRFALFVTTLPICRRCAQAACVDTLAWFISLEVTKEERRAYSWSERSWKLVFLIGIRSLGRLVVVDAVTKKPPKKTRTIPGVLGGFINI